MAIGVHAGQLCGLASEECAVRLIAAFDDARNQKLDLPRIEAAAGDVVEHKERARTADDEIVDVHRHQIDPDAVVATAGDGHQEFGADAVGAGDHYGVRESGGQAEEPRKTAEITDLLRLAGAGDERSDPLDRLVAGCDVDARISIRELGTLELAHGSAIAGPRAGGNDLA